MPAENISMNYFSGKLINWYLQNKRDLPWRNTKDPYLIWLSEIILQQTKVEQGLSYYFAFAKEFPTVKSLAQAENNKIMKLWQGLGYYSRARNLHATAKNISENYYNLFPNTYNELLKLKGVGDYTAAAIASFAFDKPHATVDGNVYRVLSRIFGISTPIDSNDGKKEFNQLANELIDKKKSATHNQAIMEFGAIQCKPINPKCSICPFSEMCFAFANNKIKELPFKAKKILVRKRFFNYIVLNHNSCIIINKREEKDIWINLYDFPLIETEKEIDEEEFLNSKNWKEFILNKKYIIKSVSITYKHILTHQKIYARFWEIECDKIFTKSLPKTCIKINRKDVWHYPVPKLIENYLNSKGSKIINKK